MIPDIGGAFADTINNITNILPPFALLSDPTNPQIDRMLCPKECDEFCECLYLIKLKLKSVVELVLIDSMCSFMHLVLSKVDVVYAIYMLFLPAMSDDILQMDHPIHLHGHHYSVMKLGTKEELKKPDFYRIDNANEYPMVRNSLPIPAAGFAVLRFIADNAG